MTAARTNEIRLDRRYRNKTVLADACLKDGVAYVLSANGRVVFEFGRSGGNRWTCYGMGRADLPCYASLTLTRSRLS
jgi:hypothetical protein